MKTFITEMIQEETGRPALWLFTIELAGKNNIIKLELERNEVFYLYEASRKAFNEYNASA